MKPKIWSDLKGYIYKPAGTSMLFWTVLKSSAFFDISPAREEYAPYEIQGLYLRKSYHGHGYGRTIMDYIKKECGAAPFYLWCLSTNSTCGYYVHMGGKEIARKDIWIGKQRYEVTCFLFEV